MATDEYDNNLYQFWQNSHTGEIANHVLNIPNSASPIPVPQSFSPNADVLTTIQASAVDFVPRVNEWTQDDLQVYNRYFPRSPSPNPFSGLSMQPSSSPSLRTDKTGRSEGSRTASTNTIIGGNPSPQAFVSFAVSTNPFISNTSPGSTFSVSPVKQPRKRQAEEPNDASRAKEKKRNKPAKPSKSAAKSQNGDNFIVWTQELAHEQNGRPKARKPWTAEEQRRRNEVVDTGGSCFKCTMLNKRCHPDRTRTCDTCRITPQLCFRKDLEHCRFFRSTTPLHLARVRESDKAWVEGDIKILQFYCVPFAVWTFSTPLTVECQRFHPTANDNLRKSPGGTNPDAWIEIEPYIAHTSANMYSTLLERMHEYRKAFLIEMMIEGASPLTINVLQLANYMAESKPKSMIHCALDIWVGAHLNAVERSLSGEETLGMPIDVISDATSFICNHIPIPPQLDNQLDMLIIDKMIIQATALLKMMWKMIKAKRKSDWLELWITTYVTLNTVEFVVKRQQLYVNEYVGKTVDLRQRVLAHWLENFKHWSRSSDHLVEAFKYYHLQEKVGMGNGRVLSTDTILQLKELNQLDKKAFRMLRDIGKNIQALNNPHPDQASQKLDPLETNFDSLWSSKIVFI